MPSILVRLNLPGYHSPDPFHLENAPSSMAGLACAVLEEIGGFSKEELEGVRGNLDQVPLTLLGELCAGQLVPLASDAQLDVFLANAESPSGPAIIEVRSRDASNMNFDESSPAPVHSPALADTIADANALAGKDSAPELTGAATEDIAHGKVGHASGPLHHNHVPLVSDTTVKARSAAEVQAVHGNALMMAPTSILEAPSQAGRVDKQDQPVEAVALKSELNSWGSMYEDVQAKSPRAKAQLAPQQHQQHSHPSSASRNGTTAIPRLRTSEGQARVKSRGSSRASTPPCERRLPWENDANRSKMSAPEFVGERSAFRKAPVHARLYQEKDDRRRRLEEARLRHYEQEEEDIRTAAKVALGRAPSPGRTSSPSRRAHSPVTKARTGARTPLATRPPMPERNTANAWSRSGWQHQDDDPCSEEAPEAQCGPALPGRSSFQGLDSVGSTALSAVEVSPSMASGRAAQDVFDIGSECAQGMRSSGVSVGTNVGEDSMCGENGVSAIAVGATENDVQQLRQMLEARQQRIEFLENMHQQALRQLRKSREELAKAQQQRFHESDRVLRLEQLVSEMQAQQFDGSVQAQLHWEEWLARSRAIFEEQQD